MFNEPYVTGPCYIREEQYSSRQLLVIQAYVVVEKDVIPVNLVLAPYRVSSCLAYLHLLQFTSMHLFSTLLASTLA